ncbi:MAG: hypothetical protein ABIQ26_13485 [Streptosporangiaceae bacterium]
MDVEERPSWAAKPLGQLTAAEIAAALEYLVTTETGDEILRRALAGQLMSGPPTAP